MPRTLRIDDRLVPRRHIQFLASGLVTCGARQTRAAAVAGVEAVAIVAPWLIPMILAYPAGATTELTFHTHSIFDGMANPGGVRGGPPEVLSCR